MQGGLFRADEMLVNAAFGLGAPVVDGMNQTVNGLTQGVVVYNQLTFQEVVVETSGIGADRDSGGTMVNIVPKEGGNTLSGTMTYNYSGSSFESNNVTDALLARGLQSTSTPSLKKYLDAGFAVGGPIQRNKLWFFGSARRGVTQQGQAGNYWNALQDGSPGLPRGVLAYAPDLSRPAFGDDVANDFTLRLTLQASAKQKFSVATPNAAQITAARWIRIGSVTHAFDFGQRANTLSFTRTSSGVDVTAPGNPNLAPPGHYLVFILNRNGVPSVGKIVRLQ